MTREPPSVRNVEESLKDMDVHNIVLGPDVGDLTVSTRNLARKFCSTCSPPWPFDRGSDNLDPLQHEGLFSYRNDSRSLNSVKRIKHVHV